jgi:hypothetical protein
MMHAVVGNTVELRIDGVFPRTSCFVHLDLQALIIRWSFKHFISLNTVEDVKLTGKRRKSTSATLMHKMSRSTKLHNGSVSSGLGSPSRKRVPSDLVPTGVIVAFSDYGGVSRALELLMPTAKANNWIATLNGLLSMIPRFVHPAHFRWAVSCMAATSERGAKGLLRRAELGSLLKCANASAQLGPEAVNTAIFAAAESTEDLELPPWLRSFPTDDYGRQVLFNTRLNTRQVAGLLFQLTTSSILIAKMFKQYAGNGPMSSDAWQTTMFKQYTSWATSSPVKARQMLVPPLRFEPRPLTK